MEIDLSVENRPFEGIKGDFKSQGRLNRITGSIVRAILLNGSILPIGGAAFGRVCAWSQRRRLVFFRYIKWWYLVAQQVHKGLALEGREGDPH